MSIRSLLKLNKVLKIPLGSLKAIFVEVSQNFIKSHLKFAQSHRYQLTAYGMYAYASSATDGRKLLRANSCAKKKYCSCRSKFFLQELTIILKGEGLVLHGSKEEVTKVVVHLSCKPITKTGLVGGLYTDRSTIQLEGLVGGLYTGISTI